MDEKQMADLIAMFKGEAKDHLAAINRNLLALERSSDEGEVHKLLEEIFRDAHSLKGASRAVGFVQIETISHHLESVFGVARREQIELSTEVCDVLYRGLDAVETILEGSQGLAEKTIDLGNLVELLELVRQGEALPRRVTLKAGDPAGEEQLDAQLETQSEEKQDEEAAMSPIVEEEVVVHPPAEVATPVMPDEVLMGADETIRVNLAKIETLMAQAGELLVSKINAEQSLADLRNVRADLDRLRSELSKQSIYRTRAKHNGNGNGSSAASYASMHEILGHYQNAMNTLSMRLNRLEKKLASDTIRLGLVTNNLQDGIRQVRMLPFDTILGGFQRMVRDLSRELGKEVDLIVEGADIELDKKVLEEIRDPLMHLLRNAIGHGIEPPDWREKAGKPRQGTIRLTITHLGNQIGIIIEDDGGGIPLAALRKAVLKAKIVDKDTLATLSDEDVTRLILLPGVTTADQVTGLSGRGVGLDVVRQKVESLQGRIDISSQAGEGTRFALNVPVSLATAHGLLVRIVDEVYAIPLSSVEKVITVKSAEIQTVEGREMIAHDGQPIALVRLSDVLERPHPTAEIPDLAQAIVLWAGQNQIAFLVDELLGEQEIVVKSLGRQLLHVRNVAGATLLGTGRVVIILNPLELIRSAQQNGRPNITTLVPVRETAGPLSTILVVDDSITTRTLEKNILEAAGYHVVTAIDGVEALGYLQTNGVDLVISDVQMPRMDGIELAEAVKDHHSQLPLILVTSLESHEDRQRGMEAGADAYIVKSAFDQEDLLVTIKQLL